MKPFNLEEAKAGKPVVTREGKSVRIICFDRGCESLPLVGLVNENGLEIIYTFTTEGFYSVNEACESSCDLFMAPEKKQGWVNIYKGNGYYGIYDTQEEAFNRRMKVTDEYITTIPIEWEE